MERSYIAIGGVALIAGFVLWKVPHIDSGSPGLNAGPVLERMRTSSAAIAPHPAQTLVGKSAAMVAPDSDGDGGSSIAPMAARPSPIVVYVVGEVRRPGVYTLAAGSRIQAALRAAGGSLDSADSVAVNQAQRLRDGQELVIPRVGNAGGTVEPAPNADPAAAGGQVSSTAVPLRVRRKASRRHRALPGSHPIEEPVSPIDVNTANAAELAALPGLGAGLALRIVEFREANGPFTNADELLDVAGVTEQRIARFESFVVFGKSQEKNRDHPGGRGS